MAERESTVTFVLKYFFARFSFPLVVLNFFGYILYSSRILLLYSLLIVVFQKILKLFFVFHIFFFHSSFSKNFSCSFKIFCLFFFPAEVFLLDLQFSVALVLPIFVVKISFSKLSFLFFLEFFFCSISLLIVITINKYPLYFFFF